MKLHPKIFSTNGFRALKTLNKAAEDPRVREIEGEGLDEGRVFICLEEGYWYGEAEGPHRMSCGNVDELRYCMSIIVCQ